jgi:hypothetical protein
VIAIAVPELEVNLVLQLLDLPLEVQERRPFVLTPYFSPVDFAMVLPTRYILVSVS